MRALERSHSAVVDPKAQIMNMIRKRTQSRLMVIFLIPVLSILLTAQAQAEVAKDRPSGAAMVGDLVIARPMGLVLFGLGSAVYLATLPFSLLGGNAGEAGQQLVLKPAEEVFVRCLGCARAGR